jgi:hypothetical protein
VNRKERLKMARGILEDAWGFRHGGDVLPTWFIQGEEGLVIIGTPFDNTPGCKEAMAESVATLVREAIPVEFVMFVSDAWTLMLDPDEALRRPSTAPDAIETITVQCWDRGGEHFSLFRRYRQTDTSELVPLDPIDELMQQGSTTGTFAAVVTALMEQED